MGRKNDTRTEAYEKLKDKAQKLQAENRKLKKQLKTFRKEVTQQKKILPLKPF